MAKLNRIFQRLFGSTGSSGDFGKFGSLAAGSPEFTQDPDEIQSLTAWLQGWGNATIADYRPALEDMNSLCYLAFYQICYLLQQGIPEYDASTTYYLNSFVQINGQIYRSLENDNIGNAPASSPTKWSSGIGSENVPQGVPAGGVIDFAMSSPPTGYLVCDGTAVSRTTYSALFSAIGTQHGSGDGSTTFNLPDYRGRVRVGYDVTQVEFDNIGEAGGEKTHLLTSSESGVPAHTHNAQFSTASGGGSGTFAIADNTSGRSSGANLTATNCVLANTAANASSAHNNLQPYRTVLPCIKY